MCKHMCIHACVCRRMHTRRRMYMYVCIYKDVYTYMHLHANMYTYTEHDGIYLCLYTFVAMWKAMLCIYIPIYVDTGADVQNHKSIHDSRKDAPVWDLIPTTGGHARWAPGSRRS